MTRPSPLATSRPRALKLSEEARRAAEDAILLDPEVLDGAIVGTLPNADGDLVFAYDDERLVEIFASDVFAGEGEGDLDAAREWVDFNTIGALPSMGPRAPVLLRRLDDGDEPEDGEMLVEAFGARWTCIA